MTRGVTSHPAAPEGASARSDGGARYIVSGPDALTLFARAAREHPARPAILRDHLELSYGELDEASAALACELLALPAAAGGLTAVLLEDRVQVVTALLAVLRSGGVFVPLDPEAPASHSMRILEELRPDRVVTDPLALERLRSGAIDPAATLTLEPAWHGGALPGRVRSPLAPSRGEEPAAPPIDPVAPRYVYYTSGSTGTPKGIAGTLKGLSHFVRWEVETFGITPGTRVSQLTVPSFDAFLRDVMVPLCAGGTVCIPPRPGIVLDPDELAGWLDAAAVNVVHCVPTVFGLLSRAGEDARLARLRTVLMAGEVLPVSDVRRWMDRRGSRVELVNLYGSTETTMVKFFHRVSAADLERGFIPIGRPMTGAKALVLDDALRVCPAGAVGEIYIRSPFLTLGYLRRPDLTAEVFVPNPFSGDPRDRVFRTGDLGRVLEDGTLQFLGRRDQQLKVRGVRVEPGEVVNALCRHPAVQAAAVVPREDAGGLSLAAYVAAADAGDELAEQLRVHLEERLPRYLVPSFIVVLDRLPRLPNGKLDLRSLPDPRTATPEAVAPRTETESELAAIWAEVLGRPRVGVNEDFFRIGGHSLLATQVVSRIRGTMAIELPLRVFFEASTVEALARHVDTLRWMSREPPSGEGAREIEL